MAWVTPKSWVSTDIIADPAAELNRIEGNCKAVYDLLAMFSVMSAQTHKTDWSFPASEITTALEKNTDDNIAVFADLCGLTFTARDWAGVIFADYRLMNEWELTLALCYALVLSIMDSLRYCGTFSCGEDGDIY